MNLNHNFILNISQYFFQIRISRNSPRSYSRYICTNIAVRNVLKFTGILRYESK